jgi:hypothetical protein
MAIKLTEAILCLNCDVIYGGEESDAAGSGQHPVCPTCGSKCGWPISRWVRPVFGADFTKGVRFKSGVRKTSGKIIQGAS